MRLPATLGLVSLLVACAPPANQAAAPCVPCAQPAQAVAPPAVPPRSPELEALGQRRVELARKRVELVRVMHERGATTLADLASAYRDVAFAARDSGLRGDALQKPLEEYRDAMRRVEELTVNRYKQGAVNEGDVILVQGHVAEAEFWVAEAAAAAGGASPH
jgi:hypothetical protein